MDEHKRKRTRLNNFYQKNDHSWREMVCTKKVESRKLCWAQHEILLRLFIIQQSVREVKCTETAAKAGPRFFYFMYLVIVAQRRKAALF